ncbi:DUF2892 domain-containing protein [Pseudocolwellia sp. AS88]|jgi:hypothetical protein|uniref:YgaP family membrane protein n=1 Tax=Pseudocolwellia sp. AS88 TaxID=3063958 RepID=UPI0026ECA49B|nr:DUF2892 domain-containing protein [Pseudocolwellia sp. AS88]MDO7086630.1 DUF2892 domain-containing protein [Pseudocolwellia sp. AS88]
MKLPEVNLCKADRVVRGVLSVLLIIYVIFWHDEVGDTLLISLIWIFSILNLISFASGWCPVYHLANLSTCKNKE